MSLPCLRISAAHSPFGDITIPHLGQHRNEALTLYFYNSLLSLLGSHCRSHRALQQRFQTLELPGAAHRAHMHRCWALAIGAAAATWRPCSGPKAMLCVLRRRHRGVRPGSVCERERDGGSETHCRGERSRQGG